MKISVVIPVFNRTHQTLLAVKSVLTQTHPVYEIILVDDGSDRETREYLQANIQALSDKIEIVEIEHSGRPAVARNTGVSLCRGDWIAFLDSDDEWWPDKIEIQVGRFLSCGALAFGESPISAKTKSKLWSRLSARKLLKRNPLICSSVLVRKDLLEKVGGFPDSIFATGNEDYVTWLKISTLTSWNIYNRQSVSYRDNSKDSLSKSKSLQSYFIREIALINFADWKITSSNRLNLRLRIWMKVFGNLF
jgi:glycosyltransferase involved in cell wall biosynthesis